MSDIFSSIVWLEKLHDCHEGIFSLTISPMGKKKALISYHIIAIVTKRKKCFIKNMNLIDMNYR